MAKVIRYTKYGYEIYDTETMSYKMLDSSYTYVADFDNGLAKVSSNREGRSLYGYINEEGEEVVPADYKTLSDVYEGYVFADDIIVNINKGFVCGIKKYTGYRNCEEEIIRHIGAGIISVKYTMLNNWSGDRYSQVKYYKINREGELTPFLNNTNSEITFISNYSNNRALVQEKTYEDVPYGGNIHATYKSSKYSFAIIDEYGNILCRLNSKLHRYINDLISHANYESPFYVGILSHISGSIYRFAIATETLRLFPREEIYINIKTDNQDCYGEYDYVDPIDHCGLRRVRRNKFGWGYIDKDNIEVIACQYAKATLFINNMARVVTNKYPYRCNIDIKGNIVEELPPLYNLHYRQDLATFNIGNIKATVDRGLRNYCRYQNTELYISGFLAIDTFIDGVAIAVDKDMRCGIIDIGGNRLSEFIYDNIYDDGQYLKTHTGPDKELFCSNKAWSITLSSKKEGNKYGYLSRTGEVLVKCEFDYLSQIDNGIVRGYKDGKLCIIDIKKQKTRYYNIDGWLIDDIGSSIESYIMQKHILPFLSQEQKCLIINGVKNKKWREYFGSLSKVVDDYISQIDIIHLLENYELDITHDTTCRPGDKDDFCDTYLISNYKDNGDAYLNAFLLYKETLFSEHHYTAYSAWWNWTHSETYSNICESIPSKTQAKKNYFKQRYTKEEHKKCIIKYIHNELKDRVVLWEINRWIEPYKELLK